MHYPVKCYSHGDNLHNLRARLEDLVEIEKKRAGKRLGKLDNIMTFAHASRLLNHAILIMRMLGWAWKWAELWVEHGSSWEPLLEEGQVESNMTKAQLKIIDSTAESRCDDARKCRLAAFGAALRNRNYDTEDGYDNESLERALRSILHTQSLVGPLRDVEINVLAEWLGRAYRSNSRLLGFGNDKIPVTPVEFSTLHYDDKSPKYELGNRPLPGSTVLPHGEFFEVQVDEPDDFLKPERDEGGGFVVATETKTVRRAPAKRRRVSTGDEPRRRPGRPRKSDSSSDSSPVAASHVDHRAPPKRRGRPPLVITPSEPPPKTYPISLPIEAVTCGFGLPLQDGSPCRRARRGRPPRAKSVFVTVVTEEVVESLSFADDKELIRDAEGSSVSDHDEGADTDHDLEDSSAGEHEEEANTSTERGGEEDLKSQSDTTITLGHNEQKMKKELKESKVSVNENDGSDVSPAPRDQFSKEPTEPPPKGLAVENSANMQECLLPSEEAEEATMQSPAGIVSKTSEKSQKSLEDGKDTSCQVSEIQSDEPLEAPTDDHKAVLPEPDSPKRECPPTETDETVVGNEEGTLEDSQARVGARNVAESRASQATRSSTRYPVSPTSSKPKKADRSMTETEPMGNSDKRDRSKSLRRSARLPEHPAGAKSTGDTLSVDSSDASSFAVEPTASEKVDVLLNEVSRKSSKDPLPNRRKSSRSCSKAATEKIMSASRQSPDRRDALGSPLRDSKGRLIRKTMQTSSRFSPRKSSGAPPRRSSRLTTDGIDGLAASRAADESESSDDMSEIESSDDSDDAIPLSQLVETARSNNGDNSSESSDSSSSEEVDSEEVDNDDSEEEKERQVDSNVLNSPKGRGRLIGKRKAERDIQYETNRKSSKNKR